MEATKTRATISAKHHTNNAATQYTIRASHKIIGSIWSPCEVWNNSHSDEYQITVNVAPGYTLNSYAPTFKAAVAEFNRLTDGKYNIDTKGIPSTPAETPRISTEAAETVNVSVEGENAAERTENKPTAAEVAQMVKTELTKNKAMHTVWHLEFPDGTECQARYNYTLPEPYGDQYIYEEARDGHVFFSTTCGWRKIPSWICLKLGIDPPQTPEAPQTRQNREERQGNGNYHTFGADVPKRQTSRVGRHFHVGGAVTHKTRENATEQTGVPVVDGWQSTRGSTLAI